MLHNHRSFNRLRALRGFLFATVLTGLPSISFGSSDAQLDKRAVTDVSPDSKRLLDTILDDKASRQDKLTAYASVLQKEASNRDILLREILRSGGAEFSMQAAASLVAAGDIEDELQQSIIRSMKTWPDGYRQEFLRPQIAGSNRAELRFVPRGILQGLIEDGQTTRGQEAIITSVELAARLLAFANDPEDQALLERAVQARPSSHSLWLALGRRGPLSAESTRLMRTVMRDPSFPYLARVAAAAAGAPTDEEAAEFALGEIKKFLEEFGARDMSSSELMKVAGSRVISGKLLEEETRYKNTVWILGNLLNLKSPDAEQTTFQYLLAPDPRIRRALAVVAGKRWPQRFLDKTDAGTYPKYEAQEYEMLLALIVYSHPELRPNVESTIPQAELDTLLQRIAASVPLWWCEEARGFIAGW